MAMDVPHRGKGSLSSIRILCTNLCIRDSSLSLSGFLLLFSCQPGLVRLQIGLVVQKAGSPSVRKKSWSIVSFEMIRPRDLCTIDKQLHQDCYGRVSRMSIYGTSSRQHNRQYTILTNARPVYLIGLLFEVPMTPIKQYLTLSLRDLQFNTFQSNLLAVPWNALHIVTMLGLSYTSEIFGDISLTAIAGQIWALPFLFYLLRADAKTTSRWAVWGASTLLLSYPNGSLAFFIY
jgi:hypothetical protein